MRCLWAIIGATRADRLQNIKIREDTVTLESIAHVSSAEDSGHGCRIQRNDIVRQAFKHDFKRQRKRWSDQVRNDTGFKIPLVTARTHAINRK